MTFRWPFVLWTLLLIPALVAAYLIAQRRRMRFTVRFTNLDLLANLVAEAPRWRRHLPPGLTILALAALLVGAARPGVRTTVPREEAVVVLAMDRSGSMRATDVAPSRMEAATDAVRTFLREVPSTVRVGVVAFETEVQVLALPTTDREAVATALEAVEPGDGTALGDAIARSVEVGGLGLGQLDPSGPRDGSTAEGDGRSPLTVLLLSDGENTQGVLEPIEAAERARAAGVPIHTVALGTEAGTIEIPDEGGSTRTLPVPPDPDTLRAVADVTGGRFFAAPTEAELSSVYREMGYHVGYEPGEIELSWLCAAIGAALLLFATALSLSWFSRIP